MAALVFVAVVLLASATAASALNVVSHGGTRYFESIMNPAKDGFNSVPYAPGYTSVGQYVPWGSDTGLTYFKSGSLDVAFSEVPFSPSADTLGSSKYAIPFAAVSYSFCSKKTGSATLRLNGSQLARIYLSSSFIPWSTFIPGASGNVLPVARSDYSITNQVIGKWLKTQNSSWPFTESYPWNGYGISPKIRFVFGWANMVDALQSDSNRIGYMESGYCKLGNISAVAVNNADGKFVSTNIDPDLTVFLPTPIPPFDGTFWTGVDPVNTPGAKAYPLTSIIFMFVRKAYTADTRVQPFLKYFTTTLKFQALLPYYGLYPVPSNYLTAAIAAVDTIISSP